MTYSETLADRVRDRLGDDGDVVEHRMFGGLAFMVNGHVACGVDGDRLMVRLTPEAAEDALVEPGVSPFDVTGRPMMGMRWVAAERIEDENDLAARVDLAATRARSLPPK